MIGEHDISDADLGSDVAEGVLGLFFADSLSLKGFAAQRLKPGLFSLLRRQADSGSSSVEQQGSGVTLIEFTRNPRPRILWGVLKMRTSLMRAGSYALTKRRTFRPRRARSDAMCTRNARASSLSESSSDIFVRAQQCARRLSKCWLARASRPDHWDWLRRLAQQVWAVRECETAE